MWLKRREEIAEHPEGQVQACGSNVIAKRVIGATLVGAGGVFLYVAQQVAWALDTPVFRAWWWATAAAFGGAVVVKIMTGRRA